MNVALEMKLIFASNNKNKIAEIQQLVGDKFQIRSLEAIGCTEDIPETAHTIEGNAILKARYVYEKYGFSCFADDTGLEINALHGEPGVYSARYAGLQRNSEDNMNLVLEKLRNETNRAAQFRTVIALYLGQEQYLFEGIVEGQITLEKRGTNGFGYDPIFQPEDYTSTFAQMTLEEKANLSHRGRAVVKLIDFLDRMF